MSDVIKLLPDHVANQIAAGEVIQRPASVVKELLENSIDAGSTEIRLVVRDGGKTFIQVIDNGKGMSLTDARMCWERHATSKISSAEEIYTIKTMGFRGEALASIASVSQVELKTKKADDPLGTLIVIEATEVKKQEAISYQQGTSITVKNLFFNIPARRNFLKSNPVESRHIIDEFTRIALANPHIAMSLFNNEDEVFILRTGDHQQRIGELFGIKTEEHILRVEEETTIINVHGFIGKPEFSKKSRGEQFFFVNKRFIKDAYLNHAVVNSYENLITKEQFPFYVLYIDIDPAQIDVNIHPTKTEIKFEDERSIYQIIRAITKRGLGQYHHIPQFEPASEDTFLNLSTTSTQQSDDRISSSKISTSKWQNTFVGSSGVENKPATKNDWQQLFEVMKPKDTVGTLSSFERKNEEHHPLNEQVQQSKNIFQLHQTFIVSQIKTGIILVDQQKAHERILYEKYLDALDRKTISSQQKLFPKTVTLNSADEILLKDILPEIRLLGFDINELGKNTFVVNGVPAELNHHDEQGLVEYILENYKQQTSQTDKKEKIARTLAKRASVKSGTKLNDEEMSMIIDELFACSIPDYSPDGNKCLIKLSMEDLFGMFEKK
jgi:DNA mismatch repair protein MutL